MFWTIFSYIISSLLIGAHFLRSNNLLIVALCALFPLILLIKKPWVLIVSQIYLYFGTVIWLLTTYEIAQRRIAMNDDWVRMAIILGSVAAVTLFSGLLLNRKSFKEKYLGVAVEIDDSQSDEALAD